MQMNRRMFVRSAAITAGVAVVHGSGRSLASGLQSNEGKLLQLFKSPPKKFRPIVRWWWPGDDVTEAELRREVGALDEAGFGGAEIQAFFKGRNRAELSSEQLARINGFASPSFFEHVRVAADEARGREMFIDCTFGSGWPFGGGTGITPELAAMELRWSHCSLQGPTRWQGRLEIPSWVSGDPTRPPDALAGLPADWAERMRRRARVVAVVALRGEDAEWSFYQTGPRGRSVMRPGRLEESTAIDLTQHTRGDGLLEWEIPSGTWQVFVFVSAPTGQRVNGAAGQGPQLVLDHLNAEAFRAHAERVGGSNAPGLSEYFGNGIRAVFCDSLEVRANLFWCEDFMEEFRRRRGYDLLPYLPVLQVQSIAEPFAQFVDTPIFDCSKGGQVRRDYRRTVAELMKERFYDEFNRWAHAHKLLARTQAHGAPVDVLQVYGDADIPETEQLYDVGAYDFLKLASSAAHIRGRAMVGSESFVWPGALYQTTPEEMKRAVDELITAGVNAIVYHGFAYRIPGLAAPGWHPFSGINDSGNYSSQFNELNPLWSSFTSLNEYITRLQFISQSSQNVATVAVFRDDLAHGAEEQPPTPPLNQGLMDAGYSYDDVNASALQDSTVRTRKLVSSGGAEYGALIIPATNGLDQSVTEHAQRFAQAGFPVIVLANGPQIVENDTKLAHLVRVHLVRGTRECLTLLRRLVIPNVEFKSQPSFFVQWRMGNRTIFFLRNDSDTARHIDAIFDADGNPELWDPWTATVEALSFEPGEGGRTRVQIELQPFGSALIVFSRGLREEGVRGSLAGPTLKQVMPIGGAAGWRFTASGMMPSNPEVHLSRNMSSLIDWSLDNELRGFSGRGTYRTTFFAPKLEKGSRLVLDLGQVKEVAEVSVNGQSATTMLLRPYQTDITDQVKPGENILEITVTNTLFNCMMLQEPRRFRPGPVETESGLMPGGLLGPVQMKVIAYAS